MELDSTNGRRLLNRLEDASGRTDMEITDQINTMGFKIKEIIAFDPLHPSRFTSMAKQLCPSYIDQMICALERGNANQSWIIAHID